MIVATTTAAAATATIATTDAVVIKFIKVLLKLP